MASGEQRGMAKTRALLTETEREQIAGKHGNDRRYQATSRVRRRIKDELTADIEVLREHHPDLYEEVRAVIDPKHAEDGVIRFNGIDNRGSGRHSVKVKFRRTTGVNSPIVEILRVSSETGHNWFDHDTIKSIDEGEYQLVLYADDGRDKWHIEAGIAYHLKDDGTYKITDIDIISASEVNGGQSGDA